MTSRMAMFEQESKLRSCTNCREKRLVPREPGNYNKLRCLNCGQLLTILRDKKGKKKYKFRKGD